MSLAPMDIESETRRARQNLVGMLIATVWVGAYGSQFGGLPGALIAGGSVLALGASGVYRKAYRAEARTINLSFNYIGLGKLSEASALLDGVEQRSRFTWVRRLVDIQRAIIAMRRGNLEEAKSRLDKALDRPLGLVARANSRYQIEGAYALRAFVRASLGDADGARADIAEIRRRPNASNDALARVTLAQALLLERAGHRGQLAELLKHEETLLLEHTHPRERAIVRAFQRMLRVSAKGSVYRHAATNEALSKGEEEPALVDWVARIAPTAAPFVRAPNRGMDADAEAMKVATTVPRVTRAAVHAVESARAAGAQAARKAPWVWLGVTAFVALAMVLGLVIVNLAPGGGTPEVAGIPAPSFLGQLVPVAIVLALGGAGLYATGFFRRGRTRAPSAGLTGVHAASRHPRGSAELNALTASKSDVKAAQAHLMLACEAELRGDFAEVIAACDRGLGRLAHPRSRADADILYPDLIALRAFALAVLGRSDEADAELASLGPTYPHHARSVFRVRLVQLLAQRNRREAARWVEQGAADLPLSVREELLADVVRAVATPAQAGAGEIERLKDELHRAPSLRRWLDVVAPGIVEAFERTGQVDEVPAPRVRVAIPDRADAVDADDRDARAEMEAEEDSLELEASRQRG